MDAMTEAILSVAPHDVVLVGSSYFHVTDVRDPTHPAAPGRVWEGHWWRSGGRHWGPLTVLHMHDGKPLPQVLTAQDRTACGWADL